MKNDLFQWIDRARANRPAPILLGVNGPQGSGKSTLCQWLCEQLSASGVKALAISIDDFYLTRAEQAQLAARYGDNPYFQQRGYPGTHDIALGLRVLRALKAGTLPLSIPRYDKSAYQGLGDRRPENEWTLVDVKPDVVFLEGWMLGFTPVDDGDLPNVHFAAVNEALRGYSEWYSILDGLLQLVPDDYHHVLAWRVEAEEKMKASGRPGMSSEAIRAYIELFLPAYATYLPKLSVSAPVAHNVLRLPIGRTRLPGII